MQWSDAKAHVCILGNDCTGLGNDCKMLCNFCTFESLSNVAF